MSDLLTFIDDIIDNNEVPADMTLHQYLSRTAKYNSRCKRQFGGVRNALEEYGYYTEPQEDWTDVKHTRQIADCLRLDSEYQPYFEGEAYELLLSSGNHIRWSEDLRKLRDTLILEKYVDDVDFSEITKYQRQNGSPQHPVDRAVYAIYGSWDDFYKSIGHEPNFADSDVLIYSRLGREFERLVAEVLAELNAPRTPIASQASQSDGSRPDFVINNHAWVDAKLSRSTAFASGCKTLDKYAKQAGTLTIIYAIKDCVRKDPRAEFVHVMSLVPLMSEALRDKTIAFVKKAKEVRHGRSH